MAAVGSSSKVTTVSGLSIELQIRHLTLSLTYRTDSTSFTLGYSMHNPLGKIHNYQAQNSPLLGKGKVCVDIGSDYEFTYYLK